MSRKPLAHVEIDDMARHVQSTLRRSSDPVGESLIRQLGGMLMFAVRQHMSGKPAHPGMERMKAWGKCSKRQAQRNTAQLEAWLVLFPISDKQGGHRATRYRVNLAALKRALVALGCNPSPELFEKIDAVSKRVRGDIRGDMGGDIRGDAMSPEYKEDNNPETVSAALRVVGGRDA